jgi:hypothetical protein
MILRKLLVVFINIIIDYTIIGQSSIDIINRFSCRHFIKWYQHLRKCRHQKICFTIKVRWCNLHYLHFIISGLNSIKSQYERFSDKVLNYN